MGEAAIESIIAERKANGPYTNIFDLVKRVNQRTANKKSLESLAYAGAFDCFTDMHRAQYFATPKGEMASNFEKIIRFGNQYQNSKEQSINSLFGETHNENVTSPKLAATEPWTLTEQLDFEKEVIGIFLSGHPLDHFKFELKYYGITPLGEFKEFEDSIDLQPNPGRNFRLAGLVVDAQHRVTKNGKNFGSLSIEDYTGKADFTLWSEEYAKVSNFLNKGMTVITNGFFKPRMRFNSNQERYQDGWEFKVTSMQLMETLKRTLTRQVKLTISARHIDEKLIDFLQKNFKRNPGSAKLSIQVIDEKQEIKVELNSFGQGIEMNDDLAQFLGEKPELDVMVETA